MGQDRGYKQIKKANKQYRSIVDQNTSDLLAALNTTRERFAGAADQYKNAGTQLTQNIQNFGAAQAYRQGTGGAIGGYASVALPALAQLAAQQAQLQTGQEEYLLNALNAIKQNQTQGYGNYAQMAAGAQQFRGNLLNDINSTLTAVGSLIPGTPK